MNSKFKIGDWVSMPHSAGIRFGYTPWEVTKVEKINGTYCYVVFDTESLFQHKYFINENTIVDRLEEAK